MIEPRLTTPLADLGGGGEPEIWEALLTLHAIADESCNWLASVDPAVSASAFARQGWDLLDRHGSMSRIDPARVRITPKTHFASRGITIRSLSRYLALNFESIDLKWRRVEPAQWSAGEPNAYNIVLLPWPLPVSAGAFRPVEGPLENMDPGAFGFFEFESGTPLDLDLVSRIVKETRRKVGRVHAVILPEDAVRAEEVGPWSGSWAGSVSPF